MSDSPQVAQSGDENDSCCPNMSKPHRIAGFLICAFLGLFFGLFSFSALLPGTSTEKTGSNGIWLTGGNLLCICSTLFLTSFTNQVKKMLEPARAVNTVILLGSMAATVTFSILPLTSFFWAVIIYVAIAIQYVAMVWYILSYIPHGQEFCAGCMKSCCAGCKEACCKGSQSDKETPIV